MARFTDGTLSTLADLRAYDAEVEQAVTDACLDLNGKLNLAQTEIGLELLSASPSVPLEQVTVTDALNLWHTFRTLSDIYRDVYDRKLNDKYLVKRNEYLALGKWAATLYFNTTTTPQKEREERRNPHESSVRSGFDTEVTRRMRELCDSMRRQLQATEDRLLVAQKWLAPHEEDLDWRR